VRIGRLLALLSVLALLEHATGPSQYVMADDCERRCASDPSEPSEPGCDACPCCAPARPAAVPVGAAVIAVLASGSVFAEPLRCPTAPDPSDIPHVPKLVA